MPGARRLPAQELPDLDQERIGSERFDDETGNLIEWGMGGFHPDAMENVLKALAR